MFSSEHARSDERTIQKHNAFGPICRMVGGIKTKCSTTESADGVNIASRESSVRHIAAACRSTRDIFFVVVVVDVAVVVVWQSQTERERGR